MSRHPERRAAASGAGGAEAQREPSLVDLLYEGFYALFLLRDGATIKDESSFSDRMAELIAEVDKRARKANIDPDETLAAKYAFCAALDETVMRTQPQARALWESRPLQLRLFGDQLAGEQFFDRLDELRLRGRAHLQALEVYHMCLLLGFRGRYSINGVEKLGFITARLGEEIARMRGGARPFAPRGARPDQVANMMRRDLSLWMLSGVFLLAGAGAYGGVSALLGSGTEKSLAAYNDVVKLPPRTAHVTITLP
ncbi:MAG TPA: DotU family type IV/VI secretion system protein [Telluria sp.]